MENKNQTCVSFDNKVRVLTEGNSADVTWSCSASAVTRAAVLVANSRSGVGPGSWTLEDMNLSFLIQLVYDFLLIDRHDCVADWTHLVRENTVLLQ